MLSVLASWGIIFVITLILGYGIVEWGYRDSQFTSKMDIYLVVGLAAVTVYAQIFSLFYKVSGLSCVVLFFIGCILIILYHVTSHGKCWSKAKNSLQITPYQWIIIICILLATAAWTVGMPNHSDTNLYHNQAIQWIEKYGVVPGLGNLHNRFAYNSAFMPLQALFSLQWILDQSLHTMNGYICCIFLIYAVLTNHALKLEKLHTSDFFKFATIIYIFYTREEISSPSSDILTLLLVLYICTKWCEYIENKISDEMSYALLAVIAVYAVTVKLSSAVTVLLAIYPAFILLKKRYWKRIILNIGLGVTIAIPWLMRNIVISGYLVYPYPQIDLFKVDWKMPASILSYDSREIMVWGRGLRDVALYDLPLWKWFSTWYQQQNEKWLIIAGLLSAFIIIFKLIYKIIKEKKVEFAADILNVYSVIALIVWLNSAPLMRYGIVYLMLPLCIVGADIFKVLERFLHIQTSFLIVLEACLLIILSSYTGKILEIKAYFMQENYEWTLTEQVEFDNGCDIWFSTGNDLCSYDVFPCVVYKEMVSKIELRGEDYSDGFKIKDEYMNAVIRNDGYEWQ